MVCEKCRMEFTIKESISHWKRMLKWMEKQKPDSKPSVRKMYRDIGEIWTQDHCSLCREYNCGLLKKCPLYVYYGRCDDIDSTNFYQVVVNSKTYYECVINTRVFIVQLEALLRYDENTRKLKNE